MADPVRTCRGCRRKLPKAELTRWVAGDSGPVIDPRQQMAGRGTYTCSPACLARVNKMKHRG